MKTFDVQAIEIHAPIDRAFSYIADTHNLPEWTGAFKKVTGARALMQTPGGAVEIDLEVNASRQHGTVDWSMSFPCSTYAAGRPSLCQRVRMLSRLGSRPFTPRT